MPPKKKFFEDTSMRRLVRWKAKKREHDPNLSGDSPVKKRETRNVPSKRILLIGFTAREVRLLYKSLEDDDWSIHETLSDSITHLVIKNMGGLKNSQQVLPIYWADIYLLKPLFIPPRHSTRTPWKNEREYEYSLTESGANDKAKAEFPSMAEVLTIRDFARNRKTSGSTPILGSEPFKKVAIVAGRSKDSKQRKEYLKLVLQAGGATVVEDTVLKEWMKKRKRKKNANIERPSMVVIVSGEENLKELGLNDDTIKDLLKGCTPLFYEESISAILQPSMFVDLEYLLKLSFSFVYKNMGVDPDGKVQFPHWTESADDSVSQSAVDWLLEWLPVFRDSPSSEEQSRELLDFIVGNFINNESPRVIWLLLKECGSGREERRNDARRILEVALSSSFTPPHPEDIRVLHRSWTAWENSGRVGRGETGEDEGEPMECTPRPSAATTTSTAVDDEARKEEKRMVGSMLARFMWASCVVEARGDDFSSDFSSLLTGDDGEAEWRRKYPKISLSVLTPLAGSTPEVAAHLMDALLRAVGMSADGDIFLLRITRVCLAVIASAAFSPHRNPAADAAERMLRGSHRTEVAAEAAEVAAALIERGKERVERAKKVMKEMEEKSSAPGLSWFAVALLTCGVGADEEEDVKNMRLRLADQLAAVLHARAEEGYERPSSQLEPALGALSRLLYRLAGKGLALTRDRVEKMMEVCGKIATTRKDGFSSIARDSAAAVIGGLCGVEKEGEKMEVEGEGGVYEKSLEALYSIGAGPPRPELQFAVGEALFAAATNGAVCAARRDEYTTSEEQWRDAHASSPEWPSVNSRLEAVLNEIMEKKARSENPHLRRASTVWVLVIVLKYIDATPFLPHRDMIMRLQSAFVDGLSESDDFSQDIASKGFGVVYNLANEGLKEVLVDELMATFSEGKMVAARSGVGVVQDTPVVQEGIKTSGGEQLTTYQELSSLANELHNPELLYKFMQLAKHNDFWYAKKGAAFGFSVVFEKARRELELYFDQLIPKLFRYRYDPDGKVQASMKAIWSALTSSRKDVMFVYADAIASEITPTLTHPDWRVRESSCLAFADLLSGHSTRSMIDRLPETMATVFRVQDDVKGSVALAAKKAVKTIWKAQAKCSGGSVYVSPTIGRDPSTGRLAEGIHAQTHQSLKNISEVLNSVGLKFYHVMTKKVVLKSMEDFEVVKTIFFEYCLYVLETSECEQRDLPYNALIEIEVSTN